MAAIKPACSGEPVTDRINHGKANVETCDPMADTICPLHSSKKSRCRHNEAGRATAVGLPGFPALCTSGNGFCDHDMVRYFQSMQHHSFLSLLYLFFGQVSPMQDTVLAGHTNSFSAATSGNEGRDNVSPASSIFLRRICTTFARSQLKFHWNCIYITGSFLLYSLEAASYDGSTTNNVWISSEYSGSATDWSTFIGRHTSEFVQMKV